MTDSVGPPHPLSTSPANVLTARPNETVADVAARMARHYVGSLVVVDDVGRMIGILTERDCLQSLADRGGDLRQVLVGDLMTTEVVSTSLAAPLSEINQLMVSRHIRHLPVVADGRPVGMLSSRDVLEQQLHVTQEIAAAAEQTARLVKCLKTLNRDEVMQVIQQQVPRMFSAGQWILRVPQDQEPLGFEQPPRCCCDWQQNDPWPASAHEQGPEICLPCRRCGRGQTCVRIPLGAGDQGDGPRASDPRPQERQRNGVPEARSPTPSAADCLCMCGIQAGGPSREVLLYKARLLQEILSSALANARLYQQLRQQSLTDGLTGLSTRRVLEAVLANAVERGRRYGRPFCLAVLDVDHFKAVNDSYGHGVGDAALQHLASLLQAGLRNTDVCARYGGDEFVVLLPEVALAQAQAALERIRARVCSEALLPDGRGISFSGGLAEWTSSSNLSPQAIFRQADDGLYGAKRAGRNRIHVCQLQPESA